MKKLLPLIILLISSWSAIAQEFPSKFAPQYTGDDYIQVSTLIGGDFLAKSEFESKAEFTNRVADLLKSKKINGHTVENLIYVVKPDCSYDAEIKTFSCKAFEWSTSEKLVQQNTKYEGPSVRISSAEPLSKGLSWEWSTDPATAKNVKPLLHIAVMGRPTTDIDRLDITKIALFNFNTGEIYKTYTLKVVTLPTLQ